MNFGIQSIPAFYIYRNGELQENFVGADKVKLLSAVKTLKAALGDEEEASTPSALPNLPGAAKMTGPVSSAPDLGFVEFRPDNMVPNTFDNTANLAKMTAKVKEIVTGYGLDKASEVLEGEFTIDKVTPEVQD